MSSPHPAAQGPGVLSFGPGYARLDIPHNEDFNNVAESIRSLLNVCRLKGLSAALVVSAQDAFDWRSSLRVGVRFAATRGAVYGVRLGLVARHFNDGAHQDVLAVAREAGLDCRFFRDEPEAIAWLATGGAAPARE